MGIIELRNYCARLLPDIIFLKIRYKRNFGKKLNLKSPETFNEKIQWQKLYDRKKDYVKLVDKYLVKDYVKNIIGEEYVIPTYGVWNSFDEIEFDKLPSQFVLKCTHDSGGIVICKDKDKLDLAECRNKIEKSLKSNFYWNGREWPYKKVKPRIIAEKLLDDEINYVPKDYKIYCINGEAKYIRVCHNRYSENELSETVYDTTWKYLGFSFDEHFKISNVIEQKPKCLDELISVCNKLCQGHSQIRIDFYIVREKIYFGEITFFPASGFQKFIPEEKDYEVGKEIIL